MIPTLQLGGLGRSRFQSAGGGSATDPAWANVVSALHFDGTNGSTTITDEKGLSWAASGNAQISTTQSKFGGASLKLDGSGDYATCSAAAGTFNFLHNNSAFMMRGWIYLASAGATQVIFDTGGLASASIGLGIYRTSANAIGVDITRGTSGIYGCRLLTANSVFANNTWVHLAICNEPAASSGNRLRLYVGGVKADADDISGATSSNHTSSATYGRYVGGNSLFTNGYLDDWEIAKDEFVYSSDFTPPIAAFPNS